ncbi:uncharacterized protein EDB91DRAFT_1078429 [Suillus paluster]|uniref:uncharacterized protein n=1 Tax=Suillus paluster TaxID=48578 RepID=UPI001B85B841|nr:uncharacterized protein EDB91DRAFT_1078429 [Suillus paluster]KAG1750379.1 hypothetical protein EDB91DRAFT_1078429 [Suillus paluster]
MVISRSKDDLHRAAASEDGEGDIGNLLGGRAMDTSYPVIYKVWIWLRCREPHGGDIPGALGIVLDSAHYGLNVEDPKCSGEKSIYYTVGSLLPAASLGNKMKDPQKRMKRIGCETYGFVGWSGWHLQIRQDANQSLRKFIKGWMDRKVGGSYMNIFKEHRDIGSKSRPCHKLSEKYWSVRGYVCVQTDAADARAIGGDPKVSACRPKSRWVSDGMDRCRMDVGWMPDALEKWWI